MFKAEYFILFFCFSVSTFGQNEIQLDRPDQTETPFIVPQNYFQFESGFLMEKNSDKTVSYQLPSVLWKYGIDDRTEIRLITELSSESRKMKTEPVKFGFKTNITKSKSVIPETSFIGHLELAEDNSGKMELVPSFRFVFQNSISETLSLGYNLGMEWNENFEEDYIYTLTLGKSFTDRIGAYIELYGFLNPFHFADNRLDGGVTYLVNNDFIVDFSGGIGLSEISSKYFFAIGISHRFDLKKHIK